MNTPQFTLGQRLQRALLVALSRLPAGLQGLLAKPPVNAAGDTMAPDVALLMKLSASGPDYSDETPTAARDATERDLVLFGDRAAPCRVEEDVEIAAGLCATRYGSGAGRGLILFFHGGGFVLGSRASYAGPARLLAQATGADVLSVEYRLAPEHPFPAAHGDALAAWRYAVEHAARWGIDPGRIVVAGESAGGNIAAVLCQQVRGEQVQPVLQVLVQPVTDISQRRPSLDEFTSSPALSAKQIAWFMGHYVPEDADHADPLLCPLLARDLTGLPRAVVTLGGFDPLRDDGVAYATALLEAGVPVEVIDERDLVHGYLSYTAVSPSCARATERIGAAVAAVLDENDRTTHVTKVS